MRIHTKYNFQTRNMAYALAPPLASIFQTTTRPVKGGRNPTCPESVVHAKREWPAMTLVGNAFR